MRIWDVAFCGLQHVTYKVDRSQGLSSEKSKNYVDEGTLEDSNDDLRSETQRLSKPSKHSRHIDGFRNVLDASHLERSVQPPTRG